MLQYGEVIVDKNVLSVKPLFVSRISPSLDSRLVSMTTLLNALGEKPDLGTHGEQLPQLNLKLIIVNHEKVQHRQGFFVSFDVFHKISSGMFILIG